MAEYSTRMEKIKLFEESDPSDWQKQLLNLEKLVLFVDLDFTILTSTENPEDKSLCNITVGNRYVFLRPGVELFLWALAQYYELVVTTMSNELYCKAIMAKIDEENTIFKRRYLTNKYIREGENKLSFYRYLPVCEDLVCIIDVQPGMWDNRPNVMQVMPYFPKERANDTMEIIDSDDEQKEELYLAILYDNLLRLHDNFYFIERFNPTTAKVSTVLQDMYKMVLNSCNVYFNKENLAGESQESIDACMAIMWKLGGGAIERMNPEVTHVALNSFNNPEDVVFKGYFVTLRMIFNSLCIMSRSTNKF